MRSPLAIAIVTVFGLSVFAANSRGQSYSDRNRDSNAGDERGDSSTSLGDIGRAVYDIDDLADQMAFRYGWELQFNRGCKDSLALYKHMRTHTDLTNNLIRAYRSNCSKPFEKAACDVRESLTCIENLRKRARVSEGVNRMIDEACPLATYLHANTINFHPTRVSNPREEGFSGLQSPASRNARLRSTAFAWRG